MNVFRFEDPWLLLALLLIPAVAWLAGKRGPETSLRFSSTALARSVSRLRRSRAGRLLLALRLLAIGLLVAAFARPQGGSTRDSVDAEGIDIVVTLDLSLSMAALDLSTDQRVVTRLDAAKRVVRDFIDKREYDRIGIVAFASEAYVVSPLTLNHDWLKRNLARLELSEVEGQSTAIGTALGASVNRLRDHEARSRVIILLTDGENNSGSLTPSAAADLADEYGIKVHAIATGRQGRVPVPRLTQDGEVARNNQGDPIYTGASAKSHYNEKELREIAETTGGKFFRATAPGDLERVYEAIDRLEKTKVELESQARYTELFMWPASIGLALLALEQILANTRFRRLP